MINKEAFRDGFIDRCVEIGIEDGDLILGLYKDAMCRPLEGKTPIQNPDDKEAVERKEVELYQDYQGPGQGTPLPNPLDQRMGEPPEEVDPDVVDNMKRMKIDSEPDKELPEKKESKLDKEEKDEEEMDKKSHLALWR